MGSVITPPHLYFHSKCLRVVLNREGNTSSLRWTIHEGDKDGVDLWSWLKVRYESASKLDHLRHFYGEKISFLKLYS